MKYLLAALFVPFAILALLLYFSAGLLIHISEEMQEKFRK